MTWSLWLAAVLLVVMICMNEAAMLFVGGLILFIAFVYAWLFSALGITWLLMWMFGWSLHIYGVVLLAEIVVAMGAGMWINRNKLNGSE